MANFLSDAKKQQVIALGRLGWTLRRIEAATGVRRETAGVCLPLICPSGSRCSPEVFVMEPTHAWQLHHPALAWRLHAPGLGRVLGQR